MVYHKTWMLNALSEKDIYPHRGLCSVYWMFKNDKSIKTYKEQSAAHTTGGKIVYYSIGSQCSVDRSSRFLDI